MSIFVQLPLLLADTVTVTGTGISLGSLLAVICSWSRNQSILWAIVAAFLSWFYVIYFALTRESQP